MNMRELESERIRKIYAVCTHDWQTVRALAKQVSMSPYDVARHLQVLHKQSMLEVKFFPATVYRKRDREGLGNSPGSVLLSTLQNKVNKPD